MYKAKIFCYLVSKTLLQDLQKKDANNFLMTTISSFYCSLFSTPILLVVLIYARSSPIAPAILISQSQPVVAKKQDTASNCTVVRSKSIHIEIQRQLITVLEIVEHRSIRLSPRWKRTMQETQRCGYKNVCVEAYAHIHSLIYNVKCNGGFKDMGKCKLRMQCFKFHFGS